LFDEMTEKDADELLRIVLDANNSALGYARYEYLKEKAGEGQPIDYLCQLLNGRLEKEKYLLALHLDQKNRKE